MVTQFKCLHYNVNEIEILRFPRQYFHTLHFSMCNLHRTAQLLRGILCIKKASQGTRNSNTFHPFPLQYCPNPGCFFLFCFMLAYSVPVYNVTPKLLPSPTSVLAPFFHHSKFWILNCLHACQSTSSFAWVSLVGWRKERDRNTLLAVLDCDITITPGCQKDNFRKLFSGEAWGSKATGLYNNIY